ncbi:MAG: holin family protein [Pseudomonadota bacterium]
MGLISRLFGLGEVARGVGAAVGGVAEVFTENKTARARADHEAFIAAISQHGAEFAQGQRTAFDRLIDGANRLPRPALALATLGLFAYAMADPIGFAARMQGLALVPEPLWWLAGAVISFYFGARELHHARGAGVPGVTVARDVARTIRDIEGMRPADAAPRVAAEADENPVVAAWLARSG